MIFMGTQWIAHNKTEQWSKIFLEVNKNPLSDRQDLSQRSVCG